MKSALFALLCVCTLPVHALDASTQVARIEQVGKSPIEARFAPGGEIRLHLCSCGVELRGVDSDKLRVAYYSDRDSTDDVRVRLDASGNHAEIRVSQCPHNNFHLTIEVPKSSDLHIRMFAGELEVNGIRGNKDVELDAGELTMDVGDPADYGRVEASVSTGEIDASPFHVSKGGLFRSFHSNGPGKLRLHAHVGAGELELR
jgi:hypothetical protein